MNKLFKKEAFKQSVKDNVRTLYRRTLEEATPQQIFQAVSYAVKDVIINDWMATQKAYEEKLLGTTQEVLMEEAVETEDGIYQVGHTKEYVKIGLKTE